MAEDQRPGAVYWIDHAAVASADLDGWLDLMHDLLGARRWVQVGEGENRRAVFQKVTRYCGQDGFVSRSPLPPSKGLGQGTPRYGYFIRPEELETHLRRLDQLKVNHLDPLRTSAEGPSGTTIHWEDWDQNQYEFWAPDYMPPGAMAGEGPLHVGRLSHVVFESRDLARTTDFVTRNLNIDPIYSADIPADTASFAMAGGGRIVYKLVDELGERTTRDGKVSGPHTALAVKYSEYIPTYERMWAGLPESEGVSGGRPADPAALPPATHMHGSLAGRAWHKQFGRGDGFFDWDLNSFHFVGGVSKDEMHTYRNRFMDHYVKELLGVRVPSELLDEMEAEEARGEWADIL